MESQTRVSWKHVLSFLNMKQFDFSDLSNGNRNLSSIINLETDVLLPLAGSGRLFAFQTNNWWSQLKTAGSAIYANRHYLALHRNRAPSRLTTPSSGRCTIIGDVYIHPSAVVDSSCVVCTGIFFSDDAEQMMCDRKSKSIKAQKNFVWHFNTIN